eukprot:TRINITY_DN5507_c0_g1_i1.p1 TRINITY_DN5507_c0_g1~~TRINITY_DN5507_c0_g1_i1.p1  ORF type:complete len:489 (-),score=140.68 TRINITY_DN5507_c0_g1_i1:10-1476(-)
MEFANPFYEWNQNDDDDFISSLLNNFPTNTPLDFQEEGSSPVSNPDLNQIFPSTDSASQSPPPPQTFLNGALDCSSSYLLNSFSFENLQYQVPIPGFILPDQLSYNNNSFHTDPLLDPSQNPISPDSISESLSDESQKKRPRKRKKDKSNFQPTPVTLPREKLLTLSSKDLEEYAANLAAIRPLTPEEEKDIKRQRRLIKNRESAQASRCRRKSHMDELEQHINDLNSDKHNMSERISQLEIENKSLKQQVLQLQFALNNKETRQSITHFKSQSNNVPAAGICLLVVLFTFGMFFQSNPNMQASPFMDLLLSNTNNLPTHPALTHEINSLSNEKMSVIKTEVNLPIKEEQVSPARRYSTGRVLLELDEPELEDIQENTRISEVMVSKTKPMMTDFYPTEIVPSNEEMACDEESQAKKKRKRYDYVEDDSRKMEISVRDSIESNSSFDLKAISSLSDLHLVDPSSPLLITILIPPRNLSQPTFCIEATT